jgi:hypothetical protein
LSELATAVVSVTRTARGRYFWAAWWTGAPTYAPFRRPDASNGGAATEEAALADAARVAGRHLSPTSPYWARAVNRMLRGEPPPPPPTTRPPRPERAPRPRAPWEVLGVPRDATLAEIKRAHRALVLTAHPDHGGDAAVFREVQRAYERLISRRR